MTGDAIEAAFEVERAVSQLAVSRELLPQLLVELAGEAETPEELAFIGTSVLEDAHRALGNVALNALHSSGIDAATIEVIRSGYWE